MRHRGHKVKQPYTFTGREWDKEIELYYYRARYYDPEVGRFISFDPLLRKMGQLIQKHSCGKSFGIPSFESLIRQPESLNSFVYTTNNPVNYKDPSGLDMGVPVDPFNRGRGWCIECDWLKLS